MTGATDARGDLSGLRGFMESACFVYMTIVIFFGVLCLLDGGGFLVALGSCEDV